MLSLLSGTVALGLIGAVLGWTELCVLSWVALGCAVLNWVELCMSCTMERWIVLGWFDSYWIQ